MTKLIAITGSDGCGKSTVVDALMDCFPSSVSSDIWQPMQHENGVFSSKLQVDQYLCELAPEPRTLFLAHALLESVYKQQTEGVNFHFVNAYYYKYFASELAYGTPLSTIQSLIPLFPKPDLIIRLTLPVDQVIARKKRFSRYESGCANQPSANDFHAFQQRVAPYWNFLLDEQTISLSNEGDLDDTLAAIIQQLNKL